MTERRERRTYSEEFKEQLVELLNHGKPRREILREYDLTASSFDKWVKRINATGSSRDKDNRTPEEQEMLRLFHLFCCLYSRVRADNSLSLFPKQQDSEQSHP